MEGCLMRTTIRRGTVWGAGALTLLATFAVPTVAQAEQDAQLTVMTRNLNQGTDLAGIASAQSLTDVLSGVEKEWANVVASDIPARITALVAEIQQAQPDVIGLQEVSLWREQTTSDIILGKFEPNATQVVYDFLEMLQTQLTAAGLPYTAVSTSTNFDVEAPLPDAESANGLADIRITDRDVILVRTPLAGQFSEPANGHYASQRTVNTIAGPVTFTRGWASIDYRDDARRTARIFNSQLEADDPAWPADVQHAQGNEALGLIEASPHPVIALVDTSFAVDASASAIYQAWAQGLTDVLAAKQPAKPAVVEGADVSAPQPALRTGLIFTKGAWKSDAVGLVGDRPFSGDTAPRWASDQIGVTAKLSLAEQAPTG
jgi:hypothetical protein